MAAASGGGVEGAPTSTRQAAATAAAVIEETVKLRAAVGRLERLLHEKLPENMTTRAIFEELNGSISKVCFLLDSHGLQDFVAGAGPSPCSWGQKGRMMAVAAAGEQRGGCRRRRTPQSSFRNVTSKNLDDGQSWRKYGQKVIHSSKHPRSYFRCTHKHDQGCRAKKIVQRSEEDPSLYTITYIGEHACTDLSMAAAATSPSPFMISPSTSNSCLISFASRPSSGVLGSQDQTSPAQLASSSSTRHTRRGYFDDDMLSNLTCGSSSPDCHAETPPASAPVRGAPVSAKPEHGGDVSSGFQSPASSSMDLDLMADQLGFDQTIFLFDNDDFLS